MGRVLLVASLGLTASACATVVGGTTQEVFVESDPAGADCRLERQGSNVGIVKPTPGRVNVSRSKDALIVNCSLAGHEESNEVLSSSFTGATLGNILLGGLVGVVVDAASGANNKYPERITVIMTPTNFPNEPARDAHFAKAKVRIEQAADEELKRLRNNCGANNREICRMEEKPVADARDRAVEEIERKRLAAKVAAAS